MTRAPTFDDLFAAMAAASSGDASARAAVPEEPDLSDPATRFAIALNLLLDDLAYRVRERERTEERLRQSQRMEAIGNLAGGVAHDFNNLLSVILGYTELALADLPRDQPLAADLREVKRAADRARELTQQLLAFSRRQILEPKILDLNAVLAGMQNMLRRLLGEGIEIALLPAPDLACIKADPGQLEQVVMNLAVNAKDAMPSGGRLLIETSNVLLDASFTEQHPELVPGAYVKLCVSDTGVGMDPAVRPRVFEPFFTTKEVGKGTGLGLSMVLGIVHQSGGHVWVDSERGRGSRFTIYLPQVREEADAPPGSLQLGLGAQRGSETILLVEDEAQVRELARIVLTRSGYTVLEAQNAGEALLVCEEYAGTIDLMLTDVVMPRMTGRQLAERAAPRRPNMKVLYMSGYTDESFVSDGILEAGMAFLQKPITSETLLRKVRDVLESERTV